MPLFSTQFPTLWKCPSCDTAYKLRDVIPADAKDATFCCSHCNKHFNLYPNKLLGWSVPTAVERLNFQ